MKYQEHLNQLHELLNSDDVSKQKFAIAKAIFVGYSYLQLATYIINNKYSEILIEDNTWDDGRIYLSQKIKFAGIEVGLYITIGIYGHIIKSLVLLKHSSLQSDEWHKSENDKDYQQLINAISLELENNNS